MYYVFLVNADLLLVKNVQVIALHRIHRLSEDIDVFIPTEEMR